MRNVLSAIIQDVRVALRSLGKSPGFTCAALLILALAIGANTAIYTVIDGVLLHPIPFPDADRLVVLYQRNPRSEKNFVTYPNLLDWQRQTQAFEAIAGWRAEAFTLTHRGETEPLTGLMVSENFFSVLRTQPLFGRTLTKDEDQPGARRVVLLGEDFWKRHFAADRNILGQNLILDRHDYTVIGIVPRSIRLQRIENSFFNDVFVPLGQYDAPDVNNRSVGNGTLGLGRLKTTVTLGEARAEMDTIMRNLAATYPNEIVGVRADLVPFGEDMTGNLRPILMALGAAVGFVLLIACTNVASLALTRSIGRSQEFGIRVALGARRGRLMQQLLTESILLSIVGGVIGLFVGSWARNAAIAELPSALPVISQIQLNGRVLLFNFLVSLFTGVFFGSANAFKAARFRLHEIARQVRRRTLRDVRTQRVLIINEVALTLVLLVAAGLMIRSLHNLWNVSPGFNPEGVLFFYTALSPERSSGPDRIRVSLQELNDRLAAVPGVDSASLQGGALPFTGNESTLRFLSEQDSQTIKVSEMRIGGFYAVGPDYFKTMGIAVSRGRSFTRDDTLTSPLVTIVDEELARTVFPGQDPVGKHIRVGYWGGQHAIEIVGVAQHVKQTGLDSDATAAVRSQFYCPIAQAPDRMLPLVARGIAGIVRSKAASGTVMTSIHNELVAFDRGSVVHSEGLMTDAVAASLAGRRFSLILLCAFATIALALSMIGIYGVISYTVSLRTDEIGVRMALGAKPRNIFIDVLREGGKPGVIGVAIGLAGAAAGTRIMTNLLFGVSPTDFVTFGSAAFLLLLVTLLACYIPARRAVRVDPMVALRCI